MDETRFKQPTGYYGSVYGGGNSRISFLESATSYLSVFNTSATMAMQGGWVQLEQSDRYLALHMGKVAQGGFLHTSIEGTEYLIKNPQVEVQEEKKHGVVFPCHGNVKNVIERHLAMVRENRNDSCLRCQNRTAQHLLTCWRCKSMGAPPPD